MAFTETDKLKALAIINIFETGKAFGDYSALAVLDDGAGISYGISQFTHRSGSLAAVIDRYLKLGGEVERSEIEAKAPLYRKTTKEAMASLAADEVFKSALRKASVSIEMHEAQNQITLDLYLKPAINECEARGFSSPLSLAVVYDSMTHGSWKKVAAKVETSGNDEEAWIAEYVRLRDNWLANSPRLKKTQYRTQFFQKQIEQNNWTLELPVSVNQGKLTDDMVAAVLVTKPAQLEFPLEPATNNDHTSASTPLAENHPVGEAPPLLTKEGSLDAGDLCERSALTPSDDPPAIQPGSPETSRPQSQAVPAEPGVSGSGQEADKSDCLDKAEDAVNAAAAKYDQAERIVRTVVTRNDSAKSLWTTVAGTVWQTVWGIAGFLSGMPRVVWLVVAVIAGVLMIGYLYRQIVLGRMREAKSGQEVSDSR